MLQGIDVSHHQISTHALREEGDLPNMDAVREHMGFLPTPSAMRATKMG